MNPEAAQRTHDQQLDHAYDAMGLATYQHPVEVMEPAQEAHLVRQFADLLTPVFGFIAKGHLTGTMDMRAWVVLYCTRLDMIHGETIDQYARRRGVSHRRVQVLVNEFRAGIPGYRSSHQKSREHVARISAAQRSARSAENPAGKESFYDSGSRPGSAVRSVSPRSA